MKFVSKSSNLLIVLRAGLSAQPITGTPATPTISVRFTDGIAEVNDENLIEMMLKHPGFNSDFISAATPEDDIYASARQASEPVHVMTELKHGTPVSREVKGGKTALSPELQKLIQSQANEIANKMLPGMVESTIKAIVDKKASQDVINPEKENTVDIPEPIVSEVTRTEPTPVSEVTPVETPKRRGRPSSK
jgi:hypothetical protein